MNWVVQSKRMKLTSGSSQRETRKVNIRPNGRPYSTRSSGMEKIQLPLYSMQGRRPADTSGKSDARRFCLRRTRWGYTNNFRWFLKECEWHFTIEATIRNSTNIFKRSHSKSKYGPLASSKSPCYLELHSGLATASPPLGTVCTKRR